jgi:copper chaperone CopZ
MSCGHCSKSVHEAIAAVPGVDTVEVSLEEKKAVWTEKSPVDRDLVKKAVLAIGFDPE